MDVAKERAAQKVDVLL